jgi:hypothetical protein
MKVDIYGGEAFPIYSVFRHTEETNWTIIEVPPETLKRWKQAFDDFEKAQEEIVSELESQGRGEEVWAGRIWGGWEAGEIE